MNIIEQCLVILERVAQSIPVELFSLFGSFIEEVISPIPSPFVMTTAGTIAKIQGYPLIYLLVLALIAAFGKTLGAWILYFLGDKFEDVFLGKMGKFIGVSHSEVENIGKHFSRGLKDDLILFVLRAVPIIPNGPVSVVSGIIKINLVTYLRASFVGNFVRNLLFLYVGYSSLAIYEPLLKGIDSLETIVQLIMIVIIVGFFAWIYYKRHKGHKLFNNF